MQIAAHRKARLCSWRAACALPLLAGVAGAVLLAEFGPSGISPRTAPIAAYVTPSANRTPDAQRAIPHARAAAGPEPASLQRDQNSAGAEERRRFLLLWIVYGMGGHPLFFK